MRNSTREYSTVVQRIMQGDDAAMGKLVERFGPAMERMAEQLIGRSLQAKLDGGDLVQAVHITLWAGIRTGRFSVPTPEHLLALSKTLLTRQVARLWRSQKMTGTVEGSLSETLADGEIVAPSSHDDPQQNTEVDDLLKLFLDQLDDTDQQLVKLRFQGLSTAEAAVQMDADPGFLRVRLGRLRKKFAGFWTRLVERD